MAEFFALHAARWDELRGRLDDPRARRCRRSTRDFAAAALERGWLRLSFLEVEGTAVAALYGWRIGGRYAYFQAGFDTAWADASVGLVLMAHTVREAIEEGADEYDLLLGDEDYKARFATDERRVESLVVAGALRPDASAGPARRRRPPGHRRPVPGAALAPARPRPPPCVARMPGTRSR